jgi:hypothetical protein
MASEIFLGPDGGPYISVNENSGDIELKDNSGNVVAFWDESNTQWDFQSNDLTNLASLSAEKIVTGRSWQDVSASRSLNTTETNNSGSEIVIAVTFEADADATLIDARLIDGVSVVNEFKAVFDTGDQQSVQGTVSNGGDYEMQAFNTADYSVREWFEFRP